MNLLKYLVIDYVEVRLGKRVVPSMIIRNDATGEGEVELNVFAHSFCCCTSMQLNKMRLHLHIEDGLDGKRGGAKVSCFDSGERVAHFFVSVG